MGTIFEGKKWKIKQKEKWAVFFKESGKKEKCLGGSCIKGKYARREKEKKRKIQKIG